MPIVRGAYLSLKLGEKPLGLIRSPLRWRPEFIRGLFEQHAVGGHAEHFRQRVRPLRDMVECSSFKHEWKQIAGKGESDCIHVQKLIPEEQAQVRTAERFPQDANSALA
jgi:hypothetical protein